MRVCSYCHLLLADSEAVCSHDGAGTQPAEVPPIPPQLYEKFTNFSPYARGQTGTCHIATQQPGGYRGLLKVIPLAAVEASERVRLKRELRKQTRLSHDALPRIVDGGEVGTQLWVFREHVQGESLAQRIRRLGKLEPAEALAIAAQIASALDELQRNGLLHRDVKPGHIILHEGPDAPRMAKLIDAGVAARLPTGSVFGLLGTPAYISPEQVAGKLVSFRSDLYALGCVLFEMLSGQPPFPDDDVQAVLEAHKSVPAPELELDLPTQARSLLHALLAKEPRQRPFSAQQVRRTLEPLLAPGTALPAIGTRAPATSLRPEPGSRAAARAAGGASSQVATEELAEVDLEEIPLPGAVPGPKTLQLSDDEVDALEVTEEGSSAAETAKKSPSRPVGIPTGAAANNPGEATSGSDRKAAAGRRSVDFDVESLFDDSAHAESSLEDAAPTHIYRPGSEQDDPARRLSPAPAVNLGGTASEPPAGYKSGNRLRWVLTAAAVALLALGLIVGRGRHAAAPAAESRPQPARPAAAPTDAVPGTPTSAPSEAPAPVENAPAAMPSPAPAEPQAAAPTEPKPPEPKPSGDKQKPTEKQQPGPAAANTRSGVLPATVAAGASSASEARSGQSPATSAPGRAAELTAANAAGRAQSGSGDAKLAQASGPRADRVTKADELKTQAREHYQAGRFREAASAYQKATELNPSDPGAFAGLGASRFAADDFSAAVQAYSKAVRLQPDSSGFQAALGRAYLKKGDRDRARAAYQHALELNPNNGAAKTALEQLK